jgi:hypothetical protein
MHRRAGARRRAPRARSTDAGPARAARAAPRAGHTRARRPHRLPPQSKVNGVGTRRQVRSSNLERHRGDDPVRKREMVRRHELGFDRVTTGCQTGQRVTESLRHGDELPVDGKMYMTRIGTKGAADLARRDHVRTLETKFHGDSRSGPVVGSRRHDLQRRRRRGPRRRRGRRRGTAAAAGCKEQRRDERRNRTQPPIKPTAIPHGESI